MILIFLSFMITDEMEKKNDLFCLTAQWILHSDTEGSFDCVLMFSPTYYCIDLMEPKHTFVISFFSSSFFHSNRHVHKYPQDRRMLLTEANLLGIVSCKKLFLKDYSLLFVSSIFLPLVNDTEINARKKDCIMNKWFYYTKCSHSAKDWVVIVSLLIKATRFLPSICCINMLQLSLWISIKKYFLLMSCKGKKYVSFRKEAPKSELSLFGSPL